jgi:hypothetical protein
MKRLPGIRHIRWLYHGIRMHIHAQRWASMGIGLGVPNDADLEELQRIWEGKV